MDEGTLPLLSLSSPPPSSSSPLLSLSVTGVTEEHCSHEDGLLHSSQEHNTTVTSGLGDAGPMAEGLLEEAGPMAEALLSYEQQASHSLITESMSITSADQEKVLLLNKNTELRRVNKELMKLNEDWDQVYRNATLGLQHRVESLEHENSVLKDLNNRLLLRLEHTQCAKDYYEQSLMEELKRNQDLQEYVRVLERRFHSDQAGAPELHPSSGPPGGPMVPASGPGQQTSSPPFRNRHSNAPGGGEPAMHSGGQRELEDLKDQLEALRCQSQVYEADYQTEHADHKHTLQENRRLKKRREDMRQQVALLQEQLKVYEDDFRRERSDKQILQRLLLKRTPPSSKEHPVLIHRCNNDQQTPGGSKRAQNGPDTTPPQLQRKQHHPRCPKHKE